MGGRRAHEGAEASWEGEMGGGGGREKRLQGEMVECRGSEVGGQAGAATLAPWLGARVRGTAVTCLLPPNTTLVHDSKIKGFFPSC